MGQKLSLFVPIFLLTSLLSMADPVAEESSALGSIATFRRASLPTTGPVTANVLSNIGNEPLVLNSNGNLTNFVARRPAAYLQSTDETTKCADSPEFDLPAGAPFSPKYCSIRKRFFEKFFFDGAIAEGINGATIKFADHTAYLGFALLTFAGEAKLLAEAGLDTRSSELAISRILAEYDLLDNEAEMRAFGTAEQGFFVRDYVVPGERPDFTKLNFEPVVESDYSNADPTNRDKEMSKDQVVHILVGLWAVKQWATDQHFANKALAEYHTQRLIDFLKRERFYITRPDSDKLVARGGEAIPDAGFLLNIAGQILGQDQSQDAEVRWPIAVDYHYHAETPENCPLGTAFGCIPPIVWWDFDFKWGGGTIVVPVRAVHGQVVGRANEYQSLEDLEIPIMPLGCPISNAEFDTIIDDLNEAIRSNVNSIPEPLRNYLDIPEVPDLRADCPVLTSYKWHRDTTSFEYNLALLEMAYETDILSSTFNKIADECSDPSLDSYGHIWAKLLRALVQGTPVVDEVIVQANNWHDAAPPGGPVGDRTGNPVWFKDNRWIRCRDTNDDPGWIYNGLDFLSFDILTHLQSRNYPLEVYVAMSGQSIEIGTPSLPYDTIQEGVQGAVRSGKRVLRIQGGSYPERLIIDWPIRLENDGSGVVQIGN